MSPTHLVLEAAVGHAAISTGTRQSNWMESFHLAKPSERRVRFSLINPPFWDIPILWKPPYHERPSHVCLWHRGDPLKSSCPRQAQHWIRKASDAGSLQAKHSIAYIQAPKEKGVAEVAESYCNK